MTSMGIDLIQNGETLRSFPVAILFQIIREDLLNCVFGFQIRHAAL